MNDKELRQNIRFLKAQTSITYKEVAEYIGIRQSSIYNYLAG